MKMEEDEERGTRVLINSAWIKSFSLKKWE